LLDFVLSAYFKQLEVSLEDFDGNQTRSIIASWQSHGRTDDEIYDELEVMFPYHGHPLSWYEFAETIDTEKHDIAIAAAKKVDRELKQAASSATTEYDKKRKCAELERVEREKTMKMFDITTKEPARGVLAQLDASLAIKVGDFVNVLEDLSPLKMSHGGKGYVTGKETKDDVSTFTVKYLETEGGSRYSSESGIPVSRLTVTPLAIFGDGPKVRPQNKVVAPEDNSNGAEHSANTLKERLQEGFANGLAEGWRRRDFSKRTMSRAEISEKMLPDCLWLKGYLTDRKRKPEQYKSSGKFKACRSRFADPFSWLYLAYAWGVGKNRCMTVLASLNKPAKAQETSFAPGNVIDCARTARSYYTPEVMFVVCSQEWCQGPKELAMCWRQDFFWKKPSSRFVLGWSW
jgi:hypothetical protein